MKKWRGRRKWKAICWLVCVNRKRLFVCLLFGFFSIVFISRSSNHSHSTYLICNNVFKITSKTFIDPDKIPIVASHPIAKEHMNKLKWYSKHFVIIVLEWYWGKRAKNEKIHENTSCAMMLVISRIFLWFLSPFGFIIRELLQIWIRFFLSSSIFHSISSTVDFFFLSFFLLLFFFFFLFFWFVCLSFFSSSFFSVQIENLWVEQWKSSRIEYEKEERRERKSLLNSLEWNDPPVFHSSHQKVIYCDEIHFTKWIVKLNIILKCF